MQGVEPIERAFDFENLAIAYQTKVDDVTAIVYFDKALKAFPDFWQARAGRAQSEMRLSDLEAAVVDFDLLSKMDTTQSDAVKLPQGVHYWSVKQHEARDGTVVTLADQTPQGMIDRVRDKLALALTARCADRASNRVYNGALADCTLAMGYAPQRVEPYAWRGYVEFQTAQLPAALRDFDAVVVADPKSNWRALCARPRQAPAWETRKAATPTSRPRSRQTPTPARNLVAQKHHSLRDDAMP